ncbi:unnamed protein product [Prorocentrum cordatum]|uniref:Uncharacterized protein n=1 Tax=Prorocentrum cordatum TaxID=2364126 RepID=A0ABN9SB28_9DINO|nr:unnamed protein product [Polarella glacialis]
MYWTASVFSNSVGRLIVSEPRDDCATTAPAHPDAFYVQQLEHARRAVDDLCPDSFADKRELVQWMLNNPGSLLEAGEELPADAELELLPEPGVQEHRDDEPEFLETCADENAMQCDSEDDGDPTFSAQVIDAASPPAGAHSHNADVPALVASGVVEVR